MDISQGRLPYDCFWFLDMFMSEQELAIQIAEIDRIQIYDMNFSKACEGEVLQQFTANSACANEKNTRLLDEGMQRP